MGTFGTGILDSDNSFDIHSTFFYKFFIGFKIEKIVAELKKEYDYKQENFDEGYFADLERDEYLISILNCLWHIGKTDKVMIENIERIIKSENSLKSWEKEESRKERKEVLKEFLMKIGKPKSKIKVFFFFVLRILFYPFLFPLRFISMEKTIKRISKFFSVFVP